MRRYLRRRRATKAAGEYGLRWTEFDRNDRQKTKQKWFSTDAARERFANNLESKDNFNEFVAWSDPD